ncbi:MAG: lysylphosphatidylglycerol synthase transmembrane domain-containing protein [Vampirovibrionales bacterium]|nr:lysylphosphatidylglycerol synthase transmembrane domain-containing protein [Vampirovibrionales bacterium]
MPLSPKAVPVTSPLAADLKSSGKRKLPLKLLLKIVISIALLFYLFSATGFEKTLQELSEANLLLIPACVGIYLLAQLVSAYRWQLLAESIGMNLSLREFYDYYLMGMYFSLFLPSAIGGDVGRMYYLSKATGRKKREAALPVLADRATGLAALLLLTSLACLSPISSVVPSSVKWTIFALTGLGILGFLTVQILPVGPWLERFPKLRPFAQAEVYWKNWGLLLKTTGVSMLIHALVVLIHLTIAQALSLTIDVLYLTMVYGVISLISVIPVTFNGIGLREGGYQFLLSQYGNIPEHTGLAFGLYWFLASTFTSLMGGIVLIKGHYKTPALEELDEEG